MSIALSGSTTVAGVVGAPVRHSLSPLIHSAWIAAAGLDAVYAPFEPRLDRFETLIEGLRGGSVRGLNITIPFKERALALADRRDPAAASAGAANLLLFKADGTIEGRNTDGLGLLAAFAEQSPGFDPGAGPIAILGAGGAARGAVSALLDAGAPQVRVINRTPARAEQLAEAFGGRVRGYALEQAAAGMSGVVGLVNATSAGLGGTGSLTLPWPALPREAVVMDMVYRPLRTALLRDAQAHGHPIVDGLAMLIGQARPSFAALFDTPAPARVDVRALALRQLGEAP